MIQNYELYNPTRLIFGENRIEELNNFIPIGSKILYLYGKGSIKKNGIYKKTISSLKSFDYIEFGGIEANPTYETLMKAVILGRDEKINFIIAVGGGSVIDGAKFVAAAIPFKKDPWTILSEQAEVTESIPIGTVLTLPATGSEMNKGSVISNISTKQKLAFLSEKSFPKFSILDIEVLKSLPKKQIANGIVDAFIHVTEQYMTYPINAKLQDRFAESILKTLIEEGPKIYKDSTDKEAGANLMFCATMALNGIISAGVPTDWSIHMIGHELTAIFGIDHARTLAIILPALYSVKIEDKLEKLAQYGKNVWNISSGTNSEIAIKAIELTNDFFKSLDVPTKLSDYNIDLDTTIIEIVNRFKNRGIEALGENGIISLVDVENILIKAW